MPKWGVSRSNYFFDTERNAIAKGIESIKYLNSTIADELYEIAHSKKYDYFVDVLMDVINKSSIDTRQLDVLIKIDFFSEFGNQRELLRITDLCFNMFKRGIAKQISKDKVAGTPLQDIVAKYSIGFTKNGAESKNYTLLDVKAIMHEAEEAIKETHMPDINDTEKVKNFKEAMGYIGYVSGDDSDRRKLYILDIFPVMRKRDGKQFGYSILTRSIGSGKESRFTVFNRVYDKLPIKKDDIIFCKTFVRDGPYFTLTDYSKVN